MDTAVRLLTTVLPMAYLLTLVAYIFDFVGVHPSASRSARRLLGATLVAHAAQLVLRGVLYAHMPLASRPEVMGTVAFAVAGAYLLVERRTGVGRTGPFVVGFVLVAQTLTSCAARCSPCMPARPCWGTRRSGCRLCMVCCRSCCTARSNAAGSGSSSIASRRSTCSPG
jgi:hypothetical protein